MQCRPAWSRSRTCWTRRRSPTLIAEDDDVAGIFYTGGTTGQAKGVMLTHRNLVINAANIVVAVGYGSNSIYLHAPPMFHLADDASTWRSPCSGGVHVFIPRFDPAAVAAAIEAEKVTNTLLVPTMINALVNFPGLDAHDLSTLQMVPFGASPMPDAVLARATEKLPGCRFLHVYGMTEAAPLVTALEPRDALVPGPQPKLRQGGADGRGPHRRRRGQRSAARHRGEVQVRGPNVMLGYWNKPEQTVAALRGGWFHSGDGGYMDGTAMSIIVDRLKDMIISGGENIYSAEVESAIPCWTALPKCGGRRSPTNNGARRCTPSSCRVPGGR